MSFKNHLGRFALGVAGALGMYQGIPSEKNPAFVEAQKNESDPESNTHRSREQKEEGMQEKESSETSEMVQATKQIESLPTNLPPLRGIQQIEYANVEQKQIPPTLDWEHLESSVFEIFEGFGKRCVDRRRHSDDDPLPNDTIGLTVENRGTPEEPSYRVEVETFLDESWIEMFELTFHPQEKNVEVLPKPDLQDLIPPILVSGERDEIQAMIKQYYETIRLVQIYLQTGMNREDIKHKLEERAKKEKEQEQVAQK